MIKRVYDVFISYRSKDKAAVLEIYRRLKRSKVKAWLDKARLAGGHDFSDEIDAALQRSRAVAVLVGPSGIGPWQKKEIARAAEDKGIRLIPVLLPRLRRIPRLPIVLAGLHRIDLRKGIEKLGVVQLIDAIKGKAPKPAPENKPTPQRKNARPAAKAPAGTGGIVAINGSLAAKTIKGIITVGKGNKVRVGSRGW